MARALATTKYSATDVFAALSADGRRIESRYEVLDNYGSPVEPFELTGVTDCSVEWNGDRPIGGSCSLTMSPEAALVNQFLRRRIKPWFRVYLPDGGYAEWPMGVFVWTRPRRTTDSTGRSRWSITMADQAHLLDLGGPGLKMFWAAAGSYVLDHIATILDSVGISSAHVARGQGVKMASDAGWDIASSSGGTQTWLSILRFLNAAAGLWFPYFKPDGTYGVDKVPDLRTAAAQIRYATDSQSIMSDLDTDTRMELFANRVFFTQKNTGGGPPVIAEANADVLYPGHPGARNAIGFYVDIKGDDPFAATPQELMQNAAADLYQRIAMHQNVTVSGWLNPAHEGFDVCSLSWTDDIEFGGTTPTRVLCRERRQDLVHGTQQLTLYTLVD